MIHRLSKILSKLATFVFGSIKRSTKKNNQQNVPTSIPDLNFSGGATKLSFTQRRSCNSHTQAKI